MVYGGIKIKYKILVQGGRWNITLPKVLAQSVGLKSGDNIEFKIERGELVIRKV